MKQYGMYITPVFFKHSIIFNKKLTNIITNIYIRTIDLQQSKDLTARRALFQQESSSTQVPYTSMLTLHLSTLFIT